jgi:hypothetical protein
MRKLFLLPLLALAVAASTSILFSPGAFAADAAAVVPPVNPLVQLIVGVGSALLTGLGSWALFALRSKTALGAALLKDSAMRDALHSALENAIHFGAAYAEKYAQGLADKAAQKNAMVYGAALYTAQFSGQALAHFGIDPTTDVGLQKIAALVEAKLAKAAGITVDGTPIDVSAAVPDPAPAPAPAAAPAAKPAPAAPPVVFGPPPAVALQLTASAPRPTI